MTMTVRVSRDDGRTFGRQVVCSTGTGSKPNPMATAVWPPCRCPLCESDSPTIRKAQT